MSMWLDPVRIALDAARAPIGVFFRDDDAGWDDSRLAALLDVFEERLIPLDLAVIPQALTARLALELKRRATAQPLALHQHGFAHANHEPVGRKCEFGPSRTAEQQYQDVEQGKKLLQEPLGGAIDSIFTPPWNRCSAVTVAALRALDFAVLSRDHGAAPLHGLRELSVSVDWCRYSGDRNELGRRIAAALEQHRPAGLMLHHAVMSEEDLDALRELLHLLQRHDRADCRSMAAFISDAAEAQAECALSRSAVRPDSRREGERRRPRPRAASARRRNGSD
jgi:predicted deacetylase